MVPQEKGFVTIKKEIEIKSTFSSTIISSCFITIAIISKKYLR